MSIKFHIRRDKLKAPYRRRGLSIARDAIFTKKLYEGILANIVDVTLSPRRFKDVVIDALREAMK